MSDARRRVALTLHALAPSDRAWLLEKLDLEDRRAVQALLAELGVMRMTIEPALVEEATATPVASRAMEYDELEPRGETQPLESLTRIAHAKAEAMVRVLQDEPNAVVASVLAIGEWQWRGELLSRLGPERAKRIAELTREAIRPAPLARAAFVEAVAKRLDLVSLESSDFSRAVHLVQSTAALRRNWFSRLMPWAR